MKSRSTTFNNMAQRNKRNTTKYRFQPYRPPAKRRNTSQKGMNRLNISPSGMGRFDTKYVYDFSGASYDEISAGGNIFHLTPIAQGLDSLDDRIGNKVTAKWLTVYLNVDNSKLQVSASTENQLCRIVIFADLNNTGTIPSTGDLLSANYSIGCFNYLTKERYKILYDNLITLTRLGAGGSQWATKIQLPLKNLQIRYTGTTATDYGPGNIFMMLYVRRTGDTDQKTEYAYESCVSYTDS